MSKTLTFVVVAVVCWGSRNVGAAPFLQQAIRHLVVDTMQETVSVQDAVADYRSLANRAKIHFAIGHYEEAAQFAEASLLLETPQPKTHHLAMSAYGKCCRQEQKSVFEALRYYDRALVHLEQFLRQSHFEKSDSDVFNSISEVFYFTLFLVNNADEETKLAVYAHHRRARDVYLRVLKSKHRAGTLNNVQLSMILTRWLFEHHLYGETLRENLQKRLEVVPVILGKNIRYSNQFIRNLFLFGLDEDMKGTEDYAWFLDQLNQYDHYAVKSIIKRELAIAKRLAARRAQLRLNQKPKSNVANDDVPTGASR